jgi:hypothetical protein
VLFFTQISYLIICLILVFYTNSKINKLLLKFSIDKTSHNKINNIYIKILNKMNDQTRSLKVENDIFNGNEGAGFGY